MPNILTKWKNTSCDIEAINRICMNLQPEHLKQERKKYRFVGLQNVHESLQAHQILVLIGCMHKYIGLKVEEGQGMGKGSLIQVVNDT